MDDTVAFRDSIKNLLELLSSKEDQLKYQKDIPIANVPAELLCMWFDDCYHPNTRLFKRSFSSNEQEKLEEFNQFYDTHCKKLPDILEEMHINEDWKLIMHKAKETLEEVFAK